MLSNDELNRKLSQAPAPRVTEDVIKDRIEEVTYHRIGETVTVAHVVLNNGFSVRGEAACVNPENYDREIGERIAFDNAFNQLWPLFGFMLAEDQFRSNTPQEPPAEQQAA